MPYDSIFKRYELKYLLTGEQYVMIKKLMDEYMRNDDYGCSDVVNVYFDTPDFLLVRRSIEKPIYKEKLRIRCYGVANKNSDVFVELKRKYDSVVYKRRVLVKENRLADVLSGSGGKTQIEKEIDYFIKRYQDISPQMVISYRREALYAKDDDNLRVTFDRDILWRNYDLSLESGIYGLPVLPEGEILMEVKTADSFPLWLARFLSANRIYKTSFSKYGNAYVQYLKKLQKGGRKVA